ncbi:peptidoglycan D,D-transpeptidase FtsI family protein [Rubinisphaera brasiliensis]|uniref:Penicillin-binding protein transpeptidase n=1 Tax=Rubinisphaera brasiliensis (strain ATCC 49424 / DSM 5305 / JCM 21570 / IAM 15109 / NBRC 103401 / IFAM 1448) TaxID=756272 RepID=F0SLF0_RUBBR|nr:penicillin-binding transpeptidase domain-containing protein [Rubinisphaera brasiliensis]ADY62056.1 penicillin-binding protein transpeptidase [Rubinisphaera brasiliensis DSM 5305]
MRNQPHSQWQLIDYAADRREEAWNLDRQVELRTWLVGLFAVIVIAVVSARLYQLKAAHQDDFLANAHPTSTRSEPVPALDGRIYSNDGQLLAYDDQQFALAVHYRWLEDPPNENWWKQQARSLTDRSNWRDEQAMADAKAEVLARRDELWKRLARISGQPSAELTARRERIQTRVERIAAAVRKRQEERLEAADAPEQTATTENKSGWERWWEMLVSELTQPPRRTNRDPIIIREELDYHEVIEDIPTGLVAEIEAHPGDYPGVQVVSRTERIYPRGSFAAHVLGNRTPVRGDEKKAEEDSEDDKLSTAERTGRFGVERTYDAVLRGRAGERELTLDRRGEIVKNKVTSPSKSGQHLVLTLHSQLQETAEAQLDRLISPKPPLVPPLPRGSAYPDDTPPEGGSILVMNIYSGELLVAAAAPRPDLTRLTSGEAEYWNQLNTDSRSPLLSRITQVPLAPGSTFKILTALAHGHTTSADFRNFHCRGFLDSPKSHRCAIFRSNGVGHGEIDMPRALAESCNVYFFDAARRMGSDTLVDWCRRMRFGQPTGVDLPFERAGHVPSPEDNSNDSGFQWYSGDNLGLSIGQSYLTVTPLQMLTLTAAIANGGEIVQPTTLARVLNDDGSSSSTQPERAEPERIPFEETTLEEIRAGMRDAVANPRGTAFSSVNSPTVSIAGKTGTAQTGLNRPSHAWFVGYAPADNPQYAFVVNLAYGGGGGEKAGPLARAVLERMAELDIIAGR